MTSKPAIVLLLVNYEFELSLQECMCLCQLIHKMLSISVHH